jgi:hypothetical protein
MVWAWLGLVLCAPMAAHKKQEARSKKEKAMPRKTNKERDADRAPGSICGQGKGYARLN